MAMHVTVLSDILVTIVVQILMIVMQNLVALMAFVTYVQ